MGKFFGGLFIAYVYALYLLTGIMHLWTVYIAYKTEGIFWSFVTLCFPIISQVFWGLRAWNTYGIDSVYVQWLLIVVFCWVMNYVLAIVFSYYTDKSERIENSVATEGEVHPYGYGGWMIVLSLFLLFILWNSIKYIYTGLYPITSSVDFLEKLKVNSLWGVVIFAEWLYHLGMILLISVSCYLCIKRKKLFIKSIVFFFIFSISLIILTYFSYLLLPEMAESSIQALSGLFYWVVYAVIWVSYILKSKRVRNTFVL